MDRALVMDASVLTALIFSVFRWMPPHRLVLARAWSVFGDEGLEVGGMGRGGIVYASSAAFGPCLDGGERS